MPDGNASTVEIDLIIGYLLIKSFPSERSDSAAKMRAEESETNTLEELASSETKEAMPMGTLSQSGRGCYNL